MKQRDFLIILSFLPMVFIAPGCVTVHQAEVPIKITEFGKDVPFEACYLMCTTRRGPESQGHWWVVEDETRPPGFTISVTVKKIDSGAIISQEGYLIYLLGPYARGKTLTYQYRVFKEGFQPEDFEDRDLARSVKDSKPVAVSMEKELPGNKYSDKHVLNGAWAIANQSSFLSMEDPLSQEMVRLSLRQVRKVQKQSRSSRPVEDAGKLIKQLEKILAGSKLKTEPVPVPGVD